jgi:hypothetical protein
MGIFLRRSSLFPGLSGGIPKIPTTISVNMFFDRKSVQDALTAMERRALMKASSLVKTTAVKSIRKVGAAKPRLKLMRDNPSLTLRHIAGMTGLRKSTKRAVLQRIREIQFPPASPPGTPPHTHVPHSHMLGFRRNLYWGYDKMTRSAVVGPSKKGNDWTIPMLHEFGGQKTLAAYVWKPRYPRYIKPIVRWFSANETPGENWVPAGQRQTFKYPARPYMKPALDKSMPRLAKMFEGAFSAGLVSGPR